MRICKKARSAIAALLMIAVFITIIPLFSVGAMALENPEIAADAAYLYEYMSDTVLFNMSADKRIYPASTTKIMTVLLAIEAIDDGVCDENDIVTAAEDIWFDITPDGSTQNISAGEKMRLGDLLRCAMISSANESCNAIAAYISGDIQTFIALMNTKAKALGCNGTHFANTHGMPNDDHYTTARDICMIMATAYQHRLFRDIISTKKYTVPATEMFESRELKNTNRMINDEYREYYEFCTGGKTGYTDAAGYCLVSVAENDGLTVFSAVMGAQAVTLDDGYRQTQSFSETYKLFDWAFNNFSYQTMLSAGDIVKEIPVEMGDGADSVALCAQSSVSALLPNDADLSGCKYVINIFEENEGEGFTAPIKKGEKLGNLTVSYGGKNYGTVSLLANRSIELQKLEYIRNEIRSVLANKWVKLFIALVVLLLISYIAFVIAYNSKMRRRKQYARAAAAKRLEELRRNEAPTTGKSFEDIEEKYRRRDEFDHSMKE